MTTNRRTGSISSNHPESNSVKRTGKTRIVGSASDQGLGLEGIRVVAAEVHRNEAEGSLRAIGTPPPPPGILKSSRANSAPDSPESSEPESMGRERRPPTPPLRKDVKKVVDKRYYFPDTGARCKRAPCPHAPSGTEKKWLKEMMDYLLEKGMIRSPIPLDQPCGKEKAIQSTGKRIGSSTFYRPRGFSGGDSKPWEGEIRDLSSRQRRLQRQVEEYTEDWEFWGQLWFRQVQQRKILTGFKFGRVLRVGREGINRENQYT